MSREQLDFDEHGLSVLLVDCQLTKEDLNRLETVIDAAEDQRSYELLVLAVEELDVEDGLLSGLIEVALVHLVGVVDNLLVDLEETAWLVGKHLHLGELYGIKLLKVIQIDLILYKIRIGDLPCTMF